MLRRSTRILFSSKDRLMALSWRATFCDLTTNGKAMTVAMILHALYTLQVFPTVQETRRWNNLFCAVKRSAPSAQLATISNELHLLAMMVHVVFAPSQDASAIPSDAYDAFHALQALLERDQEHLNPSQTLLGVESLLHLKGLGLVNHSLLATLSERVPMLATQIGFANSKDICTLIRVVVTSDVEYNNEMVVRDVTRLARKHLSNDRSLREAQNLLDAIIQRRQENGATVVRRVPQSLRPLLHVIAEVGLLRLPEMSPAQIASWWCKFFYEAAGDSEFWEHRLSRNNKDSEKGGRGSPGALSMGNVVVDTAIQPLMKQLLKRLLRHNVAEGLSDTALHTVSIAISRLWTPQKSEITRSYDGFCRDQAASCGMIVEDCARAQACLMNEMLHRAAIDRTVLLDRFADCVSAFPSTTLLFSKEVSSSSMSMNNPILTLLGLIFSQAEFKLLSSRTRSHLIVVSTELLVEGVNSSSQQKAEAVVACAGVAVSSALSLENVVEICRATLRSLELVDLISLFNELCTRVYRMEKYVSPQSARNHVVLKGLLTEIHSVSLSMIRRRRPSPQVPSSTTIPLMDESLISVGALVRYVSSMSKAGVRRKAEYSLVLDLLEARPLTHFELLRILTVVARHNIDAPFLVDTVASSMLALQQSLQPRQKVMLVKCLGALRVPWSAVMKHVLEEAAIVHKSETPKLVVADTPSARSSAPREHEDDDGLKTVWFFPEEHEPRRRRGKRSSNINRDSATTTEEEGSSSISSMDAATWFFEGVSVSDLNALDVVEVFCGLVNIAVAAADAASNPNQSTATKPSSSILTATVARLNENPSLVTVIQTPAKCGDMLCACTELVDREPRGADDEVPSKVWLSSHTKQTGGPQLSRIVLRQCMDHMAQMLQRNSRSPFTDLSLLSLYWARLATYVNRVSKNLASSDEAALLSSSLRQLRQAGNQLVCKSLRSIAGSASLTPNTFLFPQLRMGFAFACFDEHCLLPSPASSTASSLESLDIVQAQRLLSHLPIDQLIKNTTTGTPQTRDVVDAVYIVTEWLRLSSRRNSIPTKQRQKEQPHSEVDLLVSSMCAQLITDVLPVVSKYLTDAEKSEISKSFEGVNIVHCMV